VMRFLGGPLTRDESDATSSSTIRVQGGSAHALTKRRSAVRITSSANDFQPRPLFHGQAGNNP